MFFSTEPRKCGSAHPCVEHPLLLRVHSLEMLEGSVFCVCANSSVNEVAVNENHGCRASL